MTNPPLTFAVRGTERPPPKAEVLRALGRVVRGLSGLFWGLPLTLVLSAKTAVSDWLRPLGLLPPVVTCGLIFYALIQLGYFQRQERVWINALERAKLLSLVMAGLTPFLYWWNIVPEVRFFGQAVAGLIFCSVLFLISLNQVLLRLAAMLPDETLRMETQLFTSLNRYLLFGVIALLAAYYLLSFLGSPFSLALQIRLGLEHSRHWLLIVMVLLPVALTMTLIWKIKEVILGGIFGQD